MLLAKPLKQSPRDVASKLIAAMELANVGISAAEVAGPSGAAFDGSNHRHHKADRQHGGMTGFR